MSLTKCIDCKEVKKHAARGLCSTCYTRRRRRHLEFGDSLPPRYRQKQLLVCIADKCIGKPRSHNLCAKHYGRFDRKRKKLVKA